ncbi:MAG: IPTL-CTERM sorting domain-containing protein, partial [candidate division Zixibacteria bacterium]|nr:IPTL-CTERM sorting domain-containing protein [candidate division Zixibacteria bacterium]
MPLHQISRSLKVSAICLLVFLLFCGYASAQDKANRTVTITCNPLYAPEFGTCNLGESLTVINGCSETIEVKFNGGTWDVITQPGTKKYGCTDDAHDCYEVRIPGKSGEYATGCSIPYSQEVVPTLSEWGLIIFSL